MKTILRHALLSLALLAGALNAQAQMKIGTSPTTIANASKLEVEATNNKKVIVDKAVGTVQVQNLPAGAVTDAIVVADPSGVLKQLDVNSLVTNVRNLSSMSYNMTTFVTPENLGEGQIQVTNYGHVDYDSQGAANINTNKSTIK